MIPTRKICIIGDFGVGKTSTVARFVHNVFSEKYLTTVGVKIDTKTVAVNDAVGDVKLVIWDIAGADRFSAVEFSYLRGAAGYLLVADGTRRNTLDIALRLRDEAEQRFGALPYVLIVNKTDLDDQWEVPEAEVEAQRDAGIDVYLTSAKTGDAVDHALTALARKLMEASDS
ncbi:MAG: Rab family GTPase [Pseudomonadota bacterium]